MDILVEAHSGIRWLVLIGLIATVVTAFVRSSRDEGPDAGWLQWVAILFDIQVALGIILYFVNQGWTQGGFIAYFHPIGMLAAIAVFHIGLGRGRKTGGGQGWRTIGLMSLLSLILVFAAIPWQRGIM
ncbi:MAG: hypothetical protein FWJ92_08665 [Actinomycetes bacterium]|jgi:hypothetical protein|nr:hypothetical protein [Acidimicrobiia bacterium]